MKKQVRLIVFDFNGVTVAGGHPEVMQVLARRYGHDWRKLWNVFYKKYHNLLAMKKISLKESWEKPLKQFAIPLTW